jgi:hypothetical protein
MLDTERQILCDLSSHANGTYSSQTHRKESTGWFTKDREREMGRLWAKGQTSNYETNKLLYLKLAKP